MSTNAQTEKSRLKFDIQDTTEKIEKVKTRTSYYTFGNRKELISMGFIDKNGIFSGTNANREYATRIDTEKVFEIRLYSSSARILSPHPAGTYQLQKDRQGQYVLKITLPKLFWKDCDLLVIQTN